MSTLGNATDWGDFSSSRTGGQAVGACSDGTYGVWGGMGGGDMDYITIQTLGSAADYANMDVPRQGCEALAGD